MRLLFSEYKSDYEHYIFPYAVWGFPDADEKPNDLFDRGFLPSSRDLKRFYLTRHVRVKLAQYKPSSENRRVLRKNAGITARLLPRKEFDFSEAKREAFKVYADIRFGKDVMTYERLDNLFNSPITSHVLVFTEEATGREAGVVTLYLEPKRMAYYYYAFYDLTLFEQNIGMYMMTCAAAYFAEQGCEYLYLGSCYSHNALYKSQFIGAEFFNGVRWSDNLKELKYLIKREENPVRAHLLETEEYRAAFCDGAEPQELAKHGLKVKS